MFNRLPSLENQRTDQSARLEAERGVYFKEVQRQTDGHTKKYGKKMIVDGKVFKSMKAAANFTNINSTTIRTRLADGINEINGYQVKYYEEEK